jgi:hypothetical protein
MDNIIKTILILTEEVDKLKVKTAELAEKKADKIESGWLNSMEVLSLLGISRRTLQTFRDNGTLPFSRIKGNFFYKLSDVQKLLNTNYTIRYKQVKTKLNEKI